MSIDDEIRAGLAAESKREAKGVDWARYQAVCDELEAVQYELEELNVKLESAFDVGYSHGLDDGHPLGKSTSGGDWTKTELFETLKEAGTL